MASEGVIILIFSQRKWFITYLLLVPKSIYQNTQWLPDGGPQQGDISIKICSKEQNRDDLNNFTFFGHIIVTNRYQ